MKKQTLKKISLIALILAQIFWGINTPIIKLGLQSVPLSLFLSVTILGAALLIAPFAIKHWKPLRRKDMMLLVVGSVVSITLGNIVLLMGLERVPSVNAPLIGLLGPLLLFILSMQFLKERISLKTFIGIVIALAGAAFILNKPWGGNADNSQEMVIGNLLLLLSVFCGVVGTLTCKPVLARIGAFQVTFMHLVVGIIPVAIYSLPYLAQVSVESVGSNGFIAIITNILLITAANCCFIYGLKYRKASEAGIFEYIHPLVTAFSAWVILSEVPTQSIIVGGILICVGIYFAEVKRVKLVRSKI